MAGPSPPELAAQRIVVVGAVIAGLSAASALLKRGVRHLTILEAEALPFSQASGRNAAIYRPVENDPSLVALAHSSLPLLRELEAQEETQLLHETGLVLLGSESAPLDTMAMVAERQGISCELTEGWQGTMGEYPIDFDGPALSVPSGGVLEPHEIGQALLRKLKEAGVEVRLNTKVSRLLQSAAPHERCTGVQLEDRETLSADWVVLAAGPSCGRLALDLGSMVPLLPLQRHLGVLATEQTVAPQSAVVWQLDPEMYFRPETGGVLVSPCDETPSRSESPQADLSAFEPVAERLQRTCAPMSSAKLRSHWACIRTKAVDGRPVIGADPNVPGLSWLAGLGGFGMTCGLGAGERLAESIANDEPDSEFSPARFHLPY